MNRDQKIGLSLGILLVGAVAAFFYRHEQPRSAPLPELQTAAELDARIAERPFAPYLDPKKPAVSEVSPAAVITPDSNLVEQGLVPQPIALEMPQEAAVVSSTSLSNTAEQVRRPAAPASSTHIVRSGDTLSSIAAQYLGSATRFGEIYDANRDRLRDANDLRVGQELRIPGAIPAQVDPVGPAPSSRTPEDSGDSTSPSLKPGKMFVPFPGNRSIPRTNPPADVEASSSGGKRLSQLPPDDVIIRR
ncbi:LysM peptidoglycan-binding domain-containing protein [bacterium]|nr:LysM peptidoglycan-binding domain-containing protein [bacterium]